VTNGSSGLGWRGTSSWQQRSSLRWNDRTYYYSPHLGKDFRLDDERQRVERNGANLVSSESAVVDGLHLPVIDLDMPHQYVPSSTEGHGHLYIDQPVTWNQYVNLMSALAEADLIGWPEYFRFLDRGAGYVRPAWVRKDPAAFQRMSSHRYVWTVGRLLTRAVYREARRQLSRVVP
jgi:hypothetical protein